MTNLGLFGLPGSGKSTLFQALTKQAVAPQFLGYDIKPHQAVVRIPDPRLDTIGALFKARQNVQNTVEFVDIPGFDPASTETKLKNAVLEHYRKCDALALVVNLFDPDSAEQAAAGMHLLLDELVLLGLVTVENVAKRLEKAARMKADKETEAKYKLLVKVQAQLEEGVPVRRMELDAQELKLLREYAFISEKPVIAVLNVADDAVAADDADIPGLPEVLAVAAAEGLTTVRLSAALQAELAGMEEAEAQEYMAEFGVQELALPRFIRASHECLGLITFFTGSEKECRAWSLKGGANAQAAAAVIHTDLARGFIRAETVSLDDFVQYEGLAGAKAAGKVRLEGKEYIVADGDILTIRFNV